jgi:large subunit ribosomal protein L21
VLESHGKEDKITVFKDKRRKDYRRKQGHRQEFSLLRVKSVKA